MIGVGGAHYLPKAALRVCCSELGNKRTGLEKLPFSSQTLSEILYLNQSQSHTFVTCHHNHVVSWALGSHSCIPSRMTSLDMR